MNLERVEELCLRHLAQATNPLVPLEKLLAACQRDPDLAGLTLRALLDFLRPHAEIEVVDGMQRDEAGMPDLLAAAGIQMGPRAILKKRMPTANQLKEMLAMQVANMVEALDTARELAVSAGDWERIEEIDEALARAKTLSSRVNKMS